MRRKNVTFVGNCQALAMCTLYREFIGAPAGENVIYFNDHDLRGQAVLDGVASADLVVVQDRDFSHELTPDAVPHADFRSFPMVMASFLWPYANEAHVRNEAQPPFSDGPYPSQLGDSYLNRLIAEGASPEEALERYSALDIGKATHLDRLAKLHVDRQRERDARTGFEIAPVIEAEFRRQPLFRTPHHPNAILFGVAARQLFTHMGAPAETVQAAVDSLEKSPFPSDELPIHPGVIRHFGLTFADETTRYSYFDEGSFTFAEFVLRYMRYESNHALRTAIETIDSENPTVNLARLEEGLAQSPDSVRGWRFKARLLDRLGRHDEAGEAIARSIALDPNDAENFIAQARWLLGRERVEEAAAAARHAVALAPRYAFGRQMLAEALLRNGAREEASRAAREAVRLAPGRPHMHQQLGIVLTQNGELKEAEAFVGKAMTMSPDDADHRNLMAEIYELQGRRAEAITLLNDGSQNTQSFSLLGNFHLRNGDLAASEAAFALGAGRDPSRPDLAECLAMVRERRRRQE
jgi:Flp pilus assembly protein TadD